MAIMNKKRVGRGLDLLQEGLYPFVEREMRSKYRDRWLINDTYSVQAKQELDKENIAIKNI